MHRGDKKHIPLEWEDSLRLVRCIPSSCGRTSFGVIDQLMPQCDRLPLRKFFQFPPTTTDKALAAKWQQSSGWVARG